jgi:hypothetical protein
VTGKRTTIGGLAAFNQGIIDASYATGAVTGGDTGGLVGGNEFGGVISNSFAAGAVNGDAGGLVGINDESSSITNSYATGSVRVRSSPPFQTWGGGLVGNNSGPISFSYSAGAVTATGTGSIIGGLIGPDGGNDNDNYWDTTTSKITNLSQGAGEPANDPGITGLSTAQFQSGLPTGFDPKIWGEKANINGGLPYLLANPPPK